MRTYAFRINESNFRPIYSRNHDIVLSHQIVSDNVLPDSSKVTVYEDHEYLRLSNIK